MEQIFLHIITVLYTTGLVHSVDPSKTKAALSDSCFPQRFHVCTSIPEAPFIQPSSDLLMMNGTGVYLLPSFTVNSNSIYPEVFPLMTSEDDSTTNVHFSLMTTDVLRQIVYAYDQTRKVIVRFSLLKDRKFETILRVPGRLTGLAVDWSSGNIFISDIERRTVSVLTSEGLFSKVLFKHHLSRPGVITIHQKKKLIIWVEHSTDTIKSAKLDGSNIRTIVKDACFVRAITIDETSETLYYYADRINKILQLQHWATDEKQTCVLRPKVVHFIEQMHFVNGYLALIQSRNQKKELIGIPANTSYTAKRRRGEVQSISPNYDRSEGKKVSGKCAAQNGGCEQICVDIKKNKAKCLCGTGFKLQSNKCVRDSEASTFVGLIVADQVMSRLYHVDIKKSRPFVIPVIGLKQPYAVTYDGNKVYWSDLELGIISRAHLNGSHQEVIYSDKEIYVTDLEMDIGTGSLYFAEYGRGQLGIINTFSVEFVRYIKKEPNYKPFGLALQFSNGRLREDQYKGMLLVSSHGKLPRLKSYLLDGRKSNVSVTSDVPVNPRGMTIYHKEFYWSDAYNGMINHQKRPDQSETIAASPEWELYDIAVDFSHIYASEGNTKSVLKMSRKGTFIKELGKGIFERPTGLHVIIPTHKKLVESCSASCRGVCVWLAGPGNKCLRNVTYHHIDATEHGLCSVPTIENGVVIDNRKGAPVVTGTVLNVDCLPGHRKKQNNGPMVCRDGNWTNIPECITDYDIHGDLKTKGWVLFTNPGKYVFYKYNFMPRFLHVILIGAGGGGYDVNNTKMAFLGQAGDGGDTIFGNLTALGGKGGKNDSGGIGGKGLRAYGENGSLNTTCSRGGDAGEIYCRHISVRNPINYCGLGGQSESCCHEFLNVADQDKCTKKQLNFGSISSNKQCSCNENGPEGGLYGGGAAGNGGGGGGGGGYTCTRVGNPDSSAIPVVVGQGGGPSYRPAGSGLVLVMWGIEDSCDANVVSESCRTSKKCGRN